MSSPSQATVFVTVANRGIGRGLAEALHSRCNHTVIAAVRNPETTTLKEYKPAEGSRLLLVKLENSLASDATDAVQNIRAAGVEGVDFAIACAGINPVDAILTIEDIDLEKLRGMFEVNTFSYVKLFQATRPLLKAADDMQGGRGPKFLAISSNAGSTVDMEPYISGKVGTYGVSKSALNYLVRRTHFENPRLTAWVMHPGFVQTDNGNAMAELFGMPQAPDTVERSVEGLLGRIDGATRVETSGKFFDIDGNELAF